MRLYRKGKAVDSGSSWFPTIDEAMNWVSESEIISIMWLKQKSFDNHFEPRGIGYRAKSERDYGLANPVVETMTLDEFEDRVHHPIQGRFYWDGKYGNTY